MNTFLDSMTTALMWVGTGDGTLWSVVGRSLWVSGWACALAALPALAMGALIASHDFRLKPVVNVVLQTFLAIPSVVLGLLVYLLLSRSGPLGGLGWLFSVKAMVLAQALLVLPLMTALARQTIEQAGPDAQDQLRSMGAGAWMRATILCWDKREALLLVLIVGFSRAVSEVGAVMVVGGNIEGFTRVMTTAIALETSKGDLPMALGLGVVLLAVVLLLNALVGVLGAWAQRQRQGVQ
jgi:tungstate transport system permease protein